MLITRIVYTTPKPSAFSIAGFPSLTFVAKTGPNFRADTLPRLTDEIVNTLSRFRKENDGSMQICLFTEKEVASLVAIGEMLLPPHGRLIQYISPQEGFAVIAVEQILSKIRELLGIEYASVKIMVLENIAHTLEKESLQEVTRVALAIDCPFLCGTALLHAFKPHA